MVDSAQQPTARPRSATTPSATPSGAGFNAGRIFGVEIGLDASLIVIALLVTFNLGAGILPVWHPEWGSGLRWSVAVAAALLFIVSILAHELSHAVVARRLGLQIRRITLFMLGGVAHMESEPDRPRTEFWVAIVGPLTSIAIGVLAMLGTSWLAPRLDPAEALDVRTLRTFGPVATLLLWLGPINVLLGLFNLIPGFPLDGGRVLRALLWGVTGNRVTASRWASLAGQAVAWLLIVSGFLMMFGWRVPVLGQGFVPGLWGVLLGWFLNSAATQSYQQVVVSEALDQVRVSQLMLTRFEVVSPELSVRELVNNYLLHTDQRAFPVIADDAFVGLVCLSDMRKAADPQRLDARVVDVMTPRHALALLPPDAPSAAALKILNDREVNQVPIVDGEHLVGLVRRQDVVKWMGLRKSSRPSHALVERPV